MAEYTALKYRVFLSYSHRDAAWGRWLRAALEAYRIDKDLVGRPTPAGPVPKTLRPIFSGRDGYLIGDPLPERHVGGAASIAVPDRALLAERGEKPTHQPGNSPLQSDGRRRSRHPGHRRRQAGRSGAPNVSRRRCASSSGRHRLMTHEGWVSRPPPTPAPKATARSSPGRRWWRAFSGSACEEIEERARAGAQTAMARPP